MTAQEQITLDRLAQRVDAGFAEIRQLMESRRLEEVRIQADLVAQQIRVKTDLDTRIALVDSRVDAYDQSRTIAEAFLKAGKWLGSALVVVLTLVIAYLSIH